MTVSLARSHSRDALAGPIRFNAPLFKSLVERLDTGRRCVVLDLGVARTQTVSLFSRYPCRLDVADVTDALDVFSGGFEPEHLPDCAEALLPEPHAEALDAVLCWDILNYLQRPALSALMSRVTARAGPGTLVHALIAYSDTHMPMRPGCFVPQEDCSIVDVSIHRREREAPRYTPYDLKHCLPEYTLERAMLLSNGMQEMLFRL